MPEQQMVAFLVWNIGRKNIDPLVQNLVIHHNIDILLLVEFYPSASGSTLSTLLISNGLVRRNTNERFGVFTRTAYGMNPVAISAVGDRVELWDWTPAPNKPNKRA